MNESHFSLRGIFLSVIPLLLLGPACSKSNPPTANVVPPAPAVSEKSSDLCHVTSVSAAMGEIEKSEAEKIALEKTAKSSPEKENFRRLYTAEVAFARSAEEELNRLTSCASKVDETTLTQLKKKVATSRANVTYLSESFPDFK